MSQFLHQVSLGITELGIIGMELLGQQWVQLMSFLLRPVAMQEPARGLCLWFGSQLGKLELGLQKGQIGGHAHFRFFRRR